MISLELKLVEIVITKGHVSEGGDELVRIIKEYYSFKKAQTTPNFHLQAQLHKVVGKHFTAIGQNALAEAEYQKAFQIYVEISKSDFSMLEIMCL